MHNAAKGKHAGIDRTKRRISTAPLWQKVLSCSMALVLVVGLAPHFGGITVAQADQADTPPATDISADTGKAGDQDDAGEGGSDDTGKAGGSGDVGEGGSGDTGKAGGSGDVGEGGSGDTGKAGGSGDTGKGGGADDTGKAGSQDDTGIAGEQDDTTEPPTEPPSGKATVTFKPNVSPEDGVIYNNGTVSITVLVGMPGTNGATVTFKNSYTGETTSEHFYVGKQVTIDIGKDVTQGNEEEFDGGITVTVKPDDSSYETVEESYNPTIVVDRKDPVISDFKFNIAPSATEDSTHYYNLDDTTLTLSATISDGYLDIDDLKSNGYKVEHISGAKSPLANATWEEVEGGYKLTQTFAAGNFVSSSQTLLKAVASISAKDKAGNKSNGGDPTYPKNSDGTQLTSDDSFTAENALFTDVEGLLEFEPVAADPETTEKSSDGSSFNGPVDISVKPTSKWPEGVSIDPAKSTVYPEATSAESLGAEKAWGDDPTKSNTYKVEGAENKNMTYVPQASITTAHGTTVKLAGDKFSIDQTTPSIEVELINPSENKQTITSDEGTYDRYLYGASEGPKLSIAVTNPSKIKDFKNVTLKIGSKNISGEDLGFTATDDEWTAEYEVSSPEATELSATLSATSIFSTETIDDSVSDDRFMIDTKPPVVTMKFIDLAYQVKVDDKIKALFGIDKTAHPTVGTATITISDDTLYKTINGTEYSDYQVTIKANGSAIDADKIEWSFAEKQITATIPYDVIAELKEGIEEWNLVVEAIDAAGNKTTFNYADDGTTVEGVDDDLADTYLLDGTPVTIEGLDFGSAKHTTYDGVTVYDAQNGLTGTLTVSDNWFDPDNSTVTITKDGSTVAALSGDKWNRTTATGPEWALSYDFKSAGTYTVTVNATDFGANGQTGTSEWVFAVDVAAPEATIALSTSPAQLVEGVDYYAADNVKATITVTDDYLVAPEKLSLKVDPADTVEGIPASIDDWTPVDGGYQVELTFMESDPETAYSIDLAVGDALDKGGFAGHSTAKTYADADKANAGATKFTVDNTAPKIDVAINKDVIPNGDRDYYDADSLVATITVTDMSFTGDAEITVEETSGTITSSWQSKGNGVWEAIVSYGETKAEKYGKINFKAVDKAKHETEYAYGTNNAFVTTKANDTAANGKDFVVDYTKPDIKIAFDKNPVGTEDMKDYFAEGPIATITVIDENFDKDKSTIDAPSASSEGKWEQQSEKNTWMRTVAYADDTDVNKLANLTVDAYDAVYVAKEKDAGSTDSSNHSDEKTYKNDVSANNADGFVVDTKAPELEVVIDQKKQDTYNGVDYYGTVTNDVLTAKLTVTDNNFNAKSEKSPIDPTYGAVATQWKPRPDDPTKWDATVTYTENTSLDALSDLEATVVDKVYTSSGGTVSGHSRDYNYGDTITKDSEGTTVTGEQFALDLTAPSLKSANALTKYSTNYGGNASQPYLFYNDKGDVAGLSLFIGDELGIKNAKAESPFTLSGAADNIGPSDTKTIKLLQGSSVSDRDAKNKTMHDSAFVTLTDYAGNYRTWNISPDGTIVLVKSGGSAIDANTAIDTLDGKLVNPTVMVLDNLAPVLSWSGAPAAGSYSNTTQTATLNIAEMNFDYLKTFASNRVVITQTKKEGNASLAQSTMTVPVSAFSGSGSSWSNTLTFSEDGHYSMTAQLTDIAGNVSNVADVAEFTIDKTAPTIEVTWDNNNARNGKYYNAGRTATVVITEHNFDPSQFTISTTGSIGGWSSNGDTHTAIVSFSTDGTYTMTVSGQDKAGNALETYNEPEFVVDLTAPRITFSQVEEYTAYNDVIAPVIIYEDEANFDSNGMTYNLVGSKNGPRTFPAGQSVSGNTGTVTYVDIERIVENDDIYTLSAHLTDLAGNEADNSIVFSVNRFGSNFIIVDEEKYTEHNGYMADAPEVLVREINVSGAESEKHGVSVTHGLATENLKLMSSGTSTSENFYIESGKESYGWSTYLYHIGSGNFKDDGNYHVVINSVDTATNLNNSASYYDPEKHDVADAEVSFVLDNADPLIEGVSVNSGQLVDANKTKVTFTVTDNIGYEQDAIKVTLDGEEAALTEENGQFTAEVPAKSWTKRDMQISATDYAGRTATVDVDGFNYTTDFLELNLPLVIGAGIVILGGGGAALVLRNRRKGEDE